MENDPLKIAMAEFICLRVAEGDTLGQIGRELGCSAGTVLNRATFSPEAVERYARARDAAADLFESRVLEAAEQADAMNSQAQRLKVDALKWVAAKRRPKVYGERAMVEHAGTVATVSTADLTPEEYATIKQMLLKDI